MSALEGAVLDLDRLDALASQRSPIHRLDPRTKVLTTFAFILIVVSFDKYAVSALFPLVLYPVSLMAMGSIPPAFVLRKILWASPFALVVGMFNPWFDRSVVLDLGPVHLTGGWVSFGSILMRFALTLSAALILIATTGMYGVSLALTRLKVPRVLTVQLLLVYRYVFVLAEEAARTVRAWRLRAVPGQKLSWRLFGFLTGALLLRAMDRAHRIHVAMLSRGFRGEIRPFQPLRLQAADVAFLLVWVSFFLIARVYNLPHILGRTVLGAVL